MQPTNYGFDPTSPHTTFVQADPCNFRSIVQKLTGASDDPSAPKLPLTLPSRATQKPPSSSSSSSFAAAVSPPSEMGSRRPPFKLHERRHRKLDQIQLSNSNRTIGYPSPSSPSSAYYFSDKTAAHHLARSPSSTSPSHLGGWRGYGGGGGGGGGEMTVMVSPVSPLDLFSRMSPGSSQSLLSPSEQEDRAIAEKGFYLHPSPLSTPRGAEPELLPLFPLHSPRHDQDR